MVITTVILNSHIYYQQNLYNFSAQNYQARKRYQAGDFDGAAKASRSAKNWSNAASIVGIIGIIAAVILVVRFLFFVG